MRHRDTIDLILNKGVNKLIKGLTANDIKAFYDYIEKTKDFKDMHISYSNGSVRLVKGAVTKNDFVIYDSEFLNGLHITFTTARKEGRVVEFRRVLANDLKTKATDCVNLDANTTTEQQLKELTDLIFNFIKRFDYVGTMHRLNVDINEKDYHKLTYGQKDNLNKLYKCKFENAFYYRVRFDDIGERDIELLYVKEPFNFLANYASGKYRPLFRGLSETFYKAQLKNVFIKIDVERFKKELQIAENHLEILDKKLTERDNLLDDYFKIPDRLQEDYDDDYRDFINYK